jgi:hypothetical protein
MGRYFSFSIKYPSDSLPGVILLERFLKADLTPYIRPKMGVTIVGGNELKFGVRRPDPLLLSEEKIIAEGITSLLGYQDATQEIIGFVEQYQGKPLWYTDFWGEILLEYATKGGIEQNWLSRYGQEGHLQYIGICRLDQADRVKTTSFSITIYCPWFFLKNWWPEDGLPRYATSETAEHNWHQLITFLHSFINMVGIDMKEIELDYEGFHMYQEREWLIDLAKKLPKLEIHFA